MFLGCTSSAKLCTSDSNIFVNQVVRRTEFESSLHNRLKCRASCMRNHLGVNACRGAITNTHADLLLISSACSSFRGHLLVEDLLPGKTLLQNTPLAFVNFYTALTKKFLLLFLLSLLDLTTENVSYSC